MQPIKQKPADLLETTGRRIEKDDAVAGSKIRCYYDGQRVLLETDDSNNDKRYFVYGNYIDEVLMMYHSLRDEDCYYGHDHLYSVVVLFDENGGVLERVEYDAYGNAHLMSSSYSPASSSARGNTYYFTGRRRDSLDSNNFNIYYYRARYYDAETGRFLQRDPLGYFDSMNLYEYVWANPISHFDPFRLAGNSLTGNPCALKTAIDMYRSLGMTPAQIAKALGTTKKVVLVVIAGACTKKAIDIVVEPLPVSPPPTTIYPPPPGTVPVPPPHIPIPPGTIPGDGAIPWPPISFPIDDAPDALPLPIGRPGPLARKCDPGRQCPKAVEAMINATIYATCKGPAAGLSCKAGDSPEVLKFKLLVTGICYNSRLAMKLWCYP